MKTYLNHNERQIAGYFAIVYGMIETVLSEPSLKNISKKEATALRYTHTHLRKYIRALLERVGEVEGDRLFRLARDNEVELKPRNYDGKLVVDREAMIEVSRMALEANCFGCERKDWNNCKLCQMMDIIGVGSTNDTEGKCEYWYDEK